MFTYAKLFFSRNGKGFLAQDVHVLDGSEVYAPVIRRFDQVADHVDGLIARVEVDVGVTPFLFFEAVLLETSLLGLLESRS